LELRPADGLSQEQRPAEEHTNHFTSDNGPWYDGSPGCFAAARTKFEGGYRVPFIVRWDGTVPRGRVCLALTSNLDIFPTLISLSGAVLPRDRIIDGISMKGLLLHPEAAQAERDIYYYHQSRLEAMRTGSWKYIRTINHYVWPIPVNKKLGRLSDHTRGPLPLLFNLRDDPGEAYNLAGRFPEKVKEMDSRMSRWEDTMAKNRLGLIGG
jgi:arylsulfatase A-like enzyme